MSKKIKPIIMLTIATIFLSDSLVSSLYSTYTRRNDIPITGAYIHSPLTSSCRGLKVMRNWSDTVRILDDHGKEKDICVRPMLGFFAFHQSGDQVQIVRGMTKGYIFGGVRPVADYYIGPHWWWVSMLGTGALFLPFIFIIILIVYISKRAKNKRQGI